MVSCLNTEYDFHVAELRKPAKRRNRRAESPSVPQKASASAVRLFRQPRGHCQYVLTEVSLGGDYYMDAVVLNGYSGAWEGFFVEFEPVADRVFNRWHTDRSRQGSDEANCRLAGTHAAQPVSVPTKTLETLPDERFVAHAGTRN